MGRSFGEQGPQCEGTGRSNFGWWPKVVAAGGGPNAVWFADKIRRKLGEGNGIKFWSHNWAGPKPLKLVYPRLFHLCTNKKALVSDSGKWIHGRWVWLLNWRRELAEREMDRVNDLLSSIANFEPRVGINDGWILSGAKDGRYSTKVAYETIRESKLEDSVELPLKEAVSMVWSMKAPHKAMVLAWRLLRNRLPTCDNLRRRNIVVGDIESLCNACIQNAETAEHIFLHCPKSERVWNGILKWLGISFICPRGVVSHFYQFTHLGKGKRAEKVLTALWSCTCWLIWKWRNESRWERKAWDINNAITEIKARMWSWNKIFNFFEFDSNFSTCLSCDMLNRIL